ncbi:class I SAM-dependent methyltransferase [Puia sp. P3]|uniref:class I SAM-dependent methyltransferase n=1 Tax=Puia sp. P3 TaxID=3423952 RepID=UPI003D6786FD
MDLELPNGDQLVLGNGNGIRAQIRIRDASFYKRCILYGNAGLGEAYADGLWDTDNITAVVSWTLQNTRSTPWWRKWNTRRSTTPGYDLNNEFFRTFLDETMTWSGAYFERDGMDLEEAQQAKYRRLSNQLCLQPTDHVLGPRLWMGQQRHLHGPPVRLYGNGPHPIGTTIPAGYPPRPPVLDSTTSSRSGRKTTVG